MNHTGVRSTGSRQAARTSRGARTMVSALPEQGECVAKRAMHRGEDGSVAQRVAARLGGPQRDHEILVAFQRLGLVGDNELLIVESRRIEQHLPHVAEL